MDAFQFAVTLLFLFTDGVMLVGALICGIGCLYFAKRTRLGREAAYRVRAYATSWEVIPDLRHGDVARAEDPGIGMLVDKPNADPNEQVATLRLALAWSRMINGPSVWWSVGLVVVTLVSGLALLLFLLFNYPAHGFDQSPVHLTEADSAYLATYFFLTVQQAVLGLSIGIGLTLMKGASILMRRQAAATETPATRILDDYRSPRIRWLFLAYALGYLALVVLLAPREVFTSPGVGLWSIGLGVVIASVEVWGAERLAPYALRWPREPLSTTPTEAAHTAERARVYAVAMLVCMQAMALIFMVATGIAAAFSLPDAFTPQDAASSRFVVAIGIYAALGLGAVIVFTLDKGRLGGRLTGWPRFGLVAMRDPWETDDVDPA